MFNRFCIFLSSPVWPPSSCVYSPVLPFTCMPCHSYCRQIGSLLLCLFHVLINSLVCWFSQWSIEKKSSSPFRRLPADHCQKIPQFYKIFTTYAFFPPSLNFPLSRPWIKKILSFSRLSHGRRGVGLIRGVHCVILSQCLTTCTAATTSALQTTGSVGRKVGVDVPEHSTWYQSTVQRLHHLTRWPREMHGHINENNIYRNWGHGLRSSRTPPLTSCHLYGPTTV